MRSGNAYDLQPIRLKLARSKEKLDGLRATVDAYLEPQPCRIEPTVVGQTYSLRTFVDREPDQEWAVDVSEIANHARSVLDQLVWQLILANGAVPAEGRTQFPVATDFAAYTKGNQPLRDRFLAGVAGKHRRIIETYQPYHAGAQATQHPLYILNEIVKREKHRAGHVVLGTATACRARIIQPNGQETLLSFKRAMTLGNNVDMLALKNSPDSLPPDAHVRLELVDFSIDVGFQNEERIVLLADIERAILMVSHIVDRCAAKM